MDLSLLELWGAMGWFARGIIIVLLLMSVFVATVAIRKALQLHRSRKATLGFSRLFSDALDHGDLDHSSQLVEQHSQSHLAASFRRVLANQQNRARLPRSEYVASVERAVELGALEQIAEFRRGLGVLATTGATAPFVGLLGTVVGVVNAFTGMALTGSGGLAAISRGIAEALVATALGLLVAIPAVWLYNYFVNRIDFISMEITHASNELADFLLRGEADPRSGGSGKASVEEWAQQAAYSPAEVDR
jgi:biopolymer transport protein ExbB